MESKHILALILLGIFTAAGAYASLKKTWVIHVIMALSLLSVFVDDATSVNFFSREFYKTMNRGIQIGVIDGGMIILFLVWRTQIRRSISFEFPPFSSFFLVFIAAGLLSWAAAPPPIELDRPVPRVMYDVLDTRLYPSFELWASFRAFLLYTFTYNYLRWFPVQGLRTIIFSLILGMVWVIVLSFIQHYHFRIDRAFGTFGHGNSFAAVTVMGFVFFFGILLGSRGVIATVSLLGLVAGLFAATVFTLSRTPLLAIPLGCLVSLSMLFRAVFRPKNILLLGTLVIIAAGGILATWNSYSNRNRTEFNFEEVIDLRVSLNRAGWNMFRENFFGVGLGNFSAMSAARYGEEANVLGSDWATPAHNIWFLIMAETGWPGLLSFAALWLAVLTYAARGVLRLDGEMRLLCAASGSALVSAHVFAISHTTFREGPISILIHVFLALLVFSITIPERRA